MASKTVPLIANPIEEDDFNSFLSNQQLIIDRVISKNIFFRSRDSFLKSNELFLELRKYIIKALSDHESINLKGRKVLVFNEINSNQFEIIMSENVIDISHNSDNIIYTKNKKNALKREGKLLRAEDEIFSIEFNIEKIDDVIGWRRDENFLKGNDLILHQMERDIKEDIKIFVEYLKKEQIVA